MPNALAALEGLRGIEELWIWGHVGLLSNATQLFSLTRLKALVLRRCASPHRVLHLLCVPPHVRRLELENVEIVPKEFRALTTLEALNLAHVKWHGALLRHVEDVTSLNSLVVKNGESATEVCLRVARIERRRRFAFQAVDRSRSKAE